MTLPGTEDEPAMTPDRRATNVKGRGQAAALVTPAASWASSPGVRRSMRANRPKDTSPEVAVRKELHSAGFRFRKHLRPVSGLRCTADIAFTRWKLAVFVDGCFWHGCPEHKTTRPVANAAWWAAKLDGNIARDRANDARLRAEGWTVMRVWEHESTHAIVDAVIRCLRRLERSDVGSIGLRRAGRREDR